MPDRPALHDELRSRPFEDPTHEAYLALLRTADRLADEMGALLREHQLSLTQYNVLRILRGAGPEGLPVHEVGARLVTREPDVSRLIERMGQAGLVERTRDTVDRRVVRCTLTVRARQLVDALDAPVTALHRRQMECLGAERLAQFSGMLADLRAAHAARR